MDGVDDKGVSRRDGTTTKSNYEQSTRAGGAHPTSASQGGRYSALNQAAFGTNFNALNQNSRTQQSGPLVYVPQRKVETEEEKIRRYERVVEKLRKMMDHERRLLKTARL